jgi:hypothetical protein
MKNYSMLSLAALAVLLVAGCVPLNYNATAKIYQDRSDIKKGVLIAGQPMKRFRGAWGDPTKTFSRRFNTGLKGNFWVGGGAFVANGRDTYDVWFYKEKQMTLIFLKEKLVYWMDSTTPPTEADFKPDTIQ